MRRRWARSTGCRATSSTPEALAEWGGGAGGAGARRSRTPRWRWPPSTARWSCRCRARLPRAERRRWSREWQRLLARVMPFDLVIDEETSWGEEVRVSQTSVCGELGPGGGRPALLLRPLRPRARLHRGHAAPLRDDLGERGGWARASSSTTRATAARRCGCGARAPTTASSWTPRRARWTPSRPGQAEQARRALAEAMAAGAAYHRDVPREPGDVPGAARGVPPLRRRDARGVTQAALTEHFLERLREVGSYSEFVETDLRARPGRLGAARGAEALARAPRHDRAEGRRRTRSTTPWRTARPWCACGIPEKVALAARARTTCPRSTGRCTGRCCAGSARRSARPRWRRRGSWPREPRAELRRDGRLRRSAGEPARPAGRSGAAARAGAEAGRAARPGRAAAGAARRAGGGSAAAGGRQGQARREDPIDTWTRRRRASSDHDHDHDHEHEDTYGMALGFRIIEDGRQALPRRGGDRARTWTTPRSWASRSSSTPWTASTRWPRRRRPTGPPGRRHRRRPHARPERPHGRAVRRHPAPAPRHSPTRSCWSTCASRREEAE